MEQTQEKKKAGVLELVTSNLYGFSRRPLKAGFLRSWLRLDSWGNRAALALIAAGIVSGLATSAALTETPPFGDDPNTVIWLLNLDLIILLLLVTIIARRIAGLWSGRKKGLAGSRLHMRLVFVFSLLATAPAIVMTVFSAFFFHFGVQSWFSERVATAINESQAVAEAYLEEHQQVIRADVLAMAHDLDRQAAILIARPEAFEKVMMTQSMLRNLTEAVVFDAGGRIIARSGMTFTLELEALPAYAVRQADEGEVVLMTGEDDDRVRALVKLDGFSDAYLFVGRMVDPVVLSRVDDTRKAAAEYETLEKQRSDLQVTITMIFLIVALLLLLAAIWFGLIFARQLVSPISALVSASDRVREGDLTARVPQFDRIDEFDVLARAFNRMTSQIEEQRGELVTANSQLDERRRFIEAVLAGVSSGIVGIDEKGEITLANASAEELFARALSGANMADIMPGVAPLLKQALEKPGRITQGEMPYAGGGEKRILLVRIAAMQGRSAVLTFDDITELQSAQRKAAWADVARRIAHEIKNPLTPIQLSAERLRRKYLGQIKEDAETFSQCTDTIIHHVDDIGRMVNEFSAFARMPEPIMRPGNVASHIGEIVTLLREAHPEIVFEIAGADIPSDAVFDSRQIRQAFTNIIQNAIDSVLAKSADGGKIAIVFARDEDSDIIVAVSDNGCGLPEGEDPDRLAEPYVTHKEKGTGLGLAIVKKIMEDHGGRIVIGTPGWIKELKGWRDLGGATVSMVLPGDETDSGWNSRVEAAS